MTRRLRIALFTHDAYGVGHVRRAVRIVRALARREPEAAILLLSGSPAASFLADLPPTADYVKIPTAVTSGTGLTRPALLPIGIAGIVDLRSAIIVRVVEAFAPDVFLVDNFPLGARFELLPALRVLHAGSARVALGLRDIVDPPERVRTEWQRDGIYDVLDRYYDRILVYGAPEILDAGEAYALAPSLLARVRYCGFVTEFPVAPSVAPSPDGGAVLLATAGGGGDGMPLLEAFIGATAEFPDHLAVVVGGEAMSAGDRVTLRAKCAAEPRIRWHDHVADLPARMTSVDLVVAMAGYNTSLEIVAAGARAVLVPRTWKSGEHAARQDGRRIDNEQLLRAASLERLGLVRVLDPRDLSPARLADAMREALSEPRPQPGGGLPLDGADRVAEELLGLARAATAVR